MLVCAWYEYWRQLSMELFFFITRYIYVRKKYGRNYKFDTWV